MTSSDKPQPLEYGYWVRLQYDPTFDHFLVSGSFGGTTPNNMFIDGAVARRRFEEYLDVFFHEAEDYKRDLRRGAKKSS